MATFFPFLASQGKEANKVIIILFLINSIYIIYYLIYIVLVLLVTLISLILINSIYITVSLIVLVLLVTLMLVRAQLLTHFAPRKSVMLLPLPERQRSIETTCNCKYYTNISVGSHYIL